MHQGTKPPCSSQKQDDDVERLQALGCAQELARRLGGLLNFTLSLSITCILAGGHHVVPRTSVQHGWGVDRAKMAFRAIVYIGVRGIKREFASTFPTAGRLYHSATILGGRGWGWTTVWFSLAGLISILATINGRT